MTGERFKQFLYEAAEICDDVREFVSIGRHLYALALSHLPPDEREAALMGIEDFRTLRTLVEKFPGASGVPEVPCGSPPLALSAPPQGRTVPP